MMDQRAVSRYAQALFELAEKEKNLESIRADFEHVRRLCDQHSEISHLVSNSTISLSEKEDFLEKIAPAEISRLLLQFLKVLVKKKRFEELPGIQEQFQKLFEKKKGIREVEAVSASELSPAGREKLKTVLEKKLRSQIRLITKTDADLIGGLVLRFEGKEINSSYKDLLEELRQRLTAVS